MIEPKLTLFKMQIKSRLGESAELCQEHFSDAPEVFNSVNMELATCKFVVSILNPVMFFIIQVNQAVIAFPPIRVDGAFKIYFVPDYSLLGDFIHQITGNIILTEV